MNLLINQLQRFNKTTKQLRSQLLTANLKFYPKSISSKIEHSKIPILRTAFYSYLIKKNDIPTQDQFYNYYIQGKYKLNDKYERQARARLIELLQTNDIETIDCLKNRVYRSYPTFIREIDLYIQLKELNYDVGINSQLDIKNDVDVYIISKDKIYGLILFVDSWNSRYWRNKKETRHKRLEDITYIELPIDIRTPNCGKYTLYEISTINQIKSILASYHHH